MVVDDATADSQQIRKETPHRNNMKANVNDTGETLISDLLKDVHEACEKLDATKFALEKATLVAAMENKVMLAVTTIKNKIQVLLMNLDLLRVNPVTDKNVENLQVSQ